jgi:inhibitor of cysteine peptidase
MTVDVMASDPAEVRVTLDGYLPDGCPKIHEITYERQGDVFTIEIITRRPAGDVACTMAIVPFTETVSLDVADIPAGEYIVRCEGFEESFTLDS